jgi:hypothetical protein
MLQIKKLAKKINDDLSTEDKRLKAFEINVIKPNEGKDGKISDGDMLFLNKEITRYQAAIVSSETTTNEVLDDSM